MFGTGKIFVLEIIARNDYTKKVFGVLRMQINVSFIGANGGNFGGENDQLKSNL